MQTVNIIVLLCGQLIILLDFFVSFSASQTIMFTNSKVALIVETTMSASK